MSASNGAPRNRPDAAPRIVPQPDDQVVHSQTPYILSLLLAPFGLLYKFVSWPLRLFAYLFPFLPRLFRANTTRGIPRRPNTSGRRPLKPRDSVARLKREFEEEYGGNTLPFYEGGYAQALDLAKKDLKFLVIFLISPEHDDTSSFIRDTILSNEVTTFFNNPANNIILWVGDVRDSEAYQVSNAMRCTKFPFTALVAHTPEQGPTSMSVISRLVGPMPPSTYLAKLQSEIASHSEKLATVRAARSAQQFERSLREQQDSAYEESLAQDRERARQRREAEAAAAEAERRKQEEAAAAANLAQNKIRWKKWRAQSIAPEPSADSKDIVRIALKMPEAARITRRFPADASIDELYAFVECYDLLQAGESSSDASKPPTYEHKYDFRIVSTLPRVVYEIGEGGTIGERVGKSGNLIVESVVDDEDDE